MMMSSFNRTGYDGMSALHMASLGGHVECCRKLLQYGIITFIIITLKMNHMKTLLFLIYFFIFRSIGEWQGQ